MRAELLAPAGSPESLRAAVAAGADAVYAGGARFGARAYADNFTTEQLLEAIDYCHLHGCRIYLTVNTLLKDSEMEELFDYLLPYYEQGLDAVILQDIGALRYIREAFPEMDIHASTQMTVCGLDGAKFLEREGVRRVVTSRELSLEEIRRIRRDTTLEIESFVHGALCYCYSGQCLLSSLIGGRSGNRGRCAQPCRLPYQTEHAEGYLLSPKDICTLEILPDILDAGVYSLKIEGRMKRAEYTAGVVRIYRKYLDHVLEHGRKNYRVSEDDRRELMALYNRGGFSAGYYRTHNGREMMSPDRANHYGTEAAKIISVRKGSLTARALEPLHKGDILEEITVPQDVKRGGTISLNTRSDSGANIKPGTILHRTRDEALISELNRLYLKAEKKERINGKLMISSGQPVILDVNMEKISVRAKGEIPQPSQNQPLTPEKAEKQIKKTGNSPFIFENLETQIDGGLFMPLQSLNELRREALDKLSGRIISSARRKTASVRPAAIPSADVEWKSHRLFASAETAVQAEALCEVSGISGIYLDSSVPELPLTVCQAEKWTHICHKAGKSCYYIMPYIFRNDIRQLFESEESGQALEIFDGVIFKNYEEFLFLCERGFSREMIPDYNVYTFNRYSEQFWREHGISKNTASPELNFRELKNRGCRDSEVLVYGRLPVMVSAQCVQKNTAKCTGKSGILWMKDRMGKQFPVKNNCSFCYNTIYNSVPLSLLENKKELDELRPRGLRLCFTVETPQSTAEIAEAFAERFTEGKELKYSFGDFTRGHFKRGVE